MVEQTGCTEGTTHLIDRQQDTVVVVLSEWLDIDPELDQLSEAAEQWRKLKLGRFVVDLEKVDFIYSRHVGRLISLKTKTRGKVGLCCAEPMILETLQLLKMEEIFPHYRTRGEALASL